MRASLIVAAGGSGSRFKKKSSKSHRNKLFSSLNGKPVLVHALSAFQKVPEITETVVAIPPRAAPLLGRFVRQFKLKRVKWVGGGKTRAESVWKALRKTHAKNPWVLVHEGARPFFSPDSLRKLFQAAGDEIDGAILAKKVVPTIKEAASDGRIRRTVDRTALYEAETPQLVRRSILEKAYAENPKALEATDEAGLLESVRGRVKVVPHDAWNPKITTVQDFELAEACLEKGRGVRTGFGRDTHRLVKGRKFYLGGIKIPFEKGPLGHSDGDALLHAICDAMLGAAGMRDIGDWFSDKNPKFKNIASRRILTTILKKIRENGWVPEHLDTVILLEKPKLGRTKQKIRRSVARLLTLSEDAVSIKAKTAEGLGPEGEGLAVTCEAIVTMSYSKGSFS